MTLTWNNKRFDWGNVAYFAALHVGALFAFTTFTWTGLYTLLALWYLSCSLGVCLGFHRLLTHRALNVPKPLEYLFTLLGMLTSEGGAIAWVAMHRMHHQLSDRPGQDLHTPKDGFWWSHLGWVLCDLSFEHREIEKRYAPELVRDPLHRFLNRFHLLPNIVLGVLLYFIGGFPLVVWGVFLRVVLGLHTTWLVNSAAHTWGYRTYETPEGSRNLWWVGLLAWGEGWHNNHHAFQRSARHGWAWWELDLTWWAIRALQAVGLARDVRLLPASAEQFRIGRRDAVELAA